MKTTTCHNQRGVYPGTWEEPTAHTTKGVAKAESATPSALDNNQRGTGLTQGTPNTGGDLHGGRRQGRECEGTNGERERLEDIHTIYATGGASDKHQQHATCEVRCAMLHATREQTRSAQSARTGGTKGRHRRTADTQRHLAAGVNPLRGGADLVLGVRLRRARELPLPLRSLAPS
jgi:hypothetical protein